MKPGVLLAFCALACFLASSWPDGSVVHGQPQCVQPIDFELPLPYTPEGVAIDPTTDALFIADYTNGAVYRYPPIYALTSTSTPLATFTGGLNGPIGISLDRSGRLYAADSFNHRVVFWNDATTSTSKSSIDGYFGTHLFPTVSATSMYYCNGVYVDPVLDRLWVSDTVDRRVLRFDNVTGKPNGAPADGVLGQPSFTVSTIALDASHIHTPYAVILDGNGGLYVTDYEYNRVVRRRNECSRHTKTRR